MPYRLVIVEVGVGAGVAVVAAAGDSMGALAMVTKMASATNPVTTAINPRLCRSACGQS